MASKPLPVKMRNSGLWMLPVSGLYTNRIVIRHERMTQPMPTRLNPPVNRYASCPSMK